MASDSDPSTTELLDPKNDEGWEDVEPDVEDRTFKSLFDDKWFGDITEMLKYDKETHEFDYVKLRNQLNLDFLDRVQLINYIRSEVQEGRPLPKVWTGSLFEDERYLKPTMEDDAVLYSLDEVDESAFDTSVPIDEKEVEIQDLRERLAQLQIQFDGYREEMHTSFQKQLDTMTQDLSSTTPPAQSEQQVSSSQAEQDSSYFTSYTHPSIHEIMLKDTVRTSTYRDFIYTYKHLFAGKTILDIGCGTGILSLFLAKAGAKLVLAVDNSSIIDKARTIIYANGMQDVIKCLRGKIEEVHLPVAKVDIIVSEWMGYGLLYESMLDSVLWARDRYLDPQTGLMVPSHATLRLAPLIDSDLRISHVDFWKDVYGFDMRAMLADEVGDEAIIRDVNQSDLPLDGTSVPFIELDLHTATSKHLTFLQPFEITWPSATSSSSSSSSSSLDGWVLWFDIFFLQSRTDKLARGTEAAQAVRMGHEAFSTGPAAPQTHWQQVALLVRDQESGFQPGQVVRGKIGYQRREGRGRSVDIEVVWEGSSAEERRQVWILD